MKNSFFLVIPPQESRPERLKEFEPKALGQWLLELPTANPGLATRLVQDFIKDANGIQMPMQTRLDALELMRPKVLIIQDYLRSRLIRTAFPKEENDLKILHVLADIEREFTIGYWMILKELTHRQASWFQGKNIALVLQRCIKGLSSVVVSHYVMGLPIPDWVWIDLHSLFKLSVGLKKDTVKVADSTNLISKASSPEECYRQIVLLSLSRPTGLMQKEIPLVYDYIESLFPYFTLMKEAVAGQQMQFAVMTDEDKPPFVQIQSSTAKNNSTLYLDLTRLYKALEKKDKFINPSQTRFASLHVLKSHEHKPTLELLEYLEHRWLGVELQKKAIFSDRLDRMIAIGMSPAHALQNPTPIPGTVAPETGDTEPETLAHSESDRLLFSVFNKTGILSVGNLITFRKVDKSSKGRSVGVVNELIVAKQSGKISYGVKLLAARYHSVYYSMANAGSDAGAMQKGLFYNTEEQVEDASFLIVDSFLLKDGDLIKMQMNQENIYLVLKGKTNVGLGYWQFECQRIAAKSEANSPSSSKKGYDFI